MKYWLLKPKTKANSTTNLIRTVMIIRLNYFIQNLSKRTVEIKNKSTNSRELYTRDSSDYENN